MIIIDKFSKNITKYIQLGKNNIFPVQYGCNNCGFGGRLHRHGFYYRNVVTKLRVSRIPILRVKCPSCNKTYSILPSFLIPYFQYSFHTIFLCLLLNYVQDFPYGKIIDQFTTANPLTLLSGAHIGFWKKRLNKNQALIIFFFAQHENFYINMNEPNIAAVLEKIKLFQCEKGSFNYHFLQETTKWFLARLSLN